MQETVASALAQLARLDPRAARLAENALASITGGSSLQDLTQRAVQEFCWYVLPVRFGGETGERMLTARSLGRLFSLLDLDRYAAICSSATTRAVLDAHSGGYDGGLAAYHRAMRASGVEPPDLPELTWGASLGSAEIEANRAVSAALELAIAAGDVRPGTRGWRPEQERFTHAFLTQPDAQGRSRLDRIREERARGWLGSPSHPHRQRLWPLLGRLIGGAEAPQDAAEALAPVRRLLDFADEGIGLTQIGYISPSVVRELCAEFDWDTSPSPPRSETDAMQLIVLNKLLRGMRAVRRSGRRLVLTRRGRHLRADDRALWRAVAENLLDADGFTQASAETLLGLLLLRTPRATGSHARAEAVGIGAEARKVLADAGWGDGGGPPEAGRFQSALLHLTWLMETLGFARSGDLVAEEGCPDLSRSGQAFALTALHLSATAPPASL
ncbi:hypothetical protein [Nocardiopsis potens]|uniref:hypothetical protein n=1 Tax=Nocardiopsis potens TaxID=1246458 RepID=UPI000349C78D|nr:hypothetical protein [Nocardiopsis potens]